MTHSVKAEANINSSKWIFHFFFANSISFPQNCMKVLGPCALNKTLSTVVHCAVLHFDEWRRWTDLWKSQKTLKKKNLQCMCLRVLLLNCLCHFSVFMKTIFSLSAVLTTCSRLGVFYCWLDHTASVFLSFIPLQFWFTHTDTTDDRLNRTSHKCFHKTRALLTAQWRKIVLFF